MILEQVGKCGISGQQDQGLPWGFGVKAQEQTWNLDEVTGQVVHQDLLHPKKSSSNVDSQVFPTKDLNKKFSGHQASSQIVFQLKNGPNSPIFLGATEFFVQVQLQLLSWENLQAHLTHFGANVLAKQVSPRSLRK